MKSGLVRRGVVVSCVVLSMRATYGAEPTHTVVRVPMTAEHWLAEKARNGEPEGKIAFSHQEGFPLDVMKLNGGNAALKNLLFRDGTIEFDLLPDGDEIPGIRFRKQGEAAAEEFYLRPSPNCPGSNDCFQYAPVINTFMLWDSYPQYQGTAMVLEKGWNHVKLVISGRRMNVYLNRSAAPTLTVGKLEADTKEGGIALRGPAYYANLTIKPNAVEGLSPVEAPDSTAGDRNLVREWSWAGFQPHTPAKTPAYSEMPTDPRAWKQVRTEAFGMVNVNRLFQPSTETGVPLVWLRTTLESDTDQNKRVSLGFEREVWVFVNGQLVTTGQNFYYPEYSRRDPDGRLAPGNGSFDLPLKKGSNEIAFALTSPWGPKRLTYYGWGLELRLDDLRGVRLPTSEASTRQRTLTHSTQQHR